MNRQTRRMLLNLATGIAVASAAALVLLPAAQAAPGVVTSNVNVRSGPGTNYSVVDSIPGGTSVDVQSCNGAFCYVQGRRVSGWVSAQFLSAQGRAVSPANPGLSFGFSVGGPGGPNINIGVGNGNQPPPRPGPIVTPRPPVYDDAEVCFYDRTRFRGDSQCFGPGEGIRDLGFDGSFQSMDNPDGLSVQVCGDRNYRDCRTYTTSASSFSSFGDIVSLRVR